jgi:uncharacterized membrane protein
MEAYLLDWLNLLGRWLHLIAGIAWIGASFYFVWLDNHLLPAADSTALDKGVSGELWAVHGGGFYNAQKYGVAPPTLPEPLHWFKWEAYITWLSGMFMLCVVYYFNAGAYLIDRSVADISSTTAILAGLAILAGGWIIYDRLCVSLSRKPLLLSAAIAILIAVAAYGVCHLFSGRGAFIHFGAMLGTIMVANVFFVIIPGQGELVKAKREGRTPDPIHGLRSKQRSVHNTYFTLPVIFTMISNHYAMTYANSANSGSGDNWIILLAISAAGAAIRTWFVARHKSHTQGAPSPLPLIVGVTLLVMVAVALVPTKQETPAGTSVVAGIDFSRAQTIVKTRCATCHSATPTQPGFNAAPKGVMLDTPERILAQTTQMHQQLMTKAMPIGNISNMTDVERTELIDWIDRGAPH